MYDVLKLTSTTDLVDIHAARMAEADRLRAIVSRLEAEAVAAQCELECRYNKGIPFTPERWAAFLHDFETNPEFNFVGPGGNV